MGQQPSMPTDLSKEVRVIGAGFSRTGTTSLALALEKLLQGPVCHGGTTLLLREEGMARIFIITCSSPTELHYINNT
jgi:Sulfotransferase domain